MTECMNNELFGERPEQYTHYTSFIILDTYRGFDDWQAAVSSKFALTYGLALKATVDRVSDYNHVFFLCINHFYRFFTRPAHCQHMCMIHPIVAGLQSNAIFLDVIGPAKTLTIRKIHTLLYVIFSFHQCICESPSERKLQEIVLA